MRGVTVDSGAPSALMATAARESMMSDRCYVIYGPTPWDSHRNAAHNYAQALAADHRVLYIDPPLSPLSPIRYGLRGETWPRARALVSRRVRTSDGVNVFAPVSLPPVQHPRMRRLSLPLVRAQIRRAVAGMGFERPAVIAWRGLAELAGVAGETYRVAVVMDHPAAGAGLLGRDPAELEAETAANCDAADLVCATSNAVQSLLEERGRASELVPFGFPADLTSAYELALQPAELQALPRPLLGYTGSVDDRLDFDLIQALADRFDQGSLVFIGAVSPRLSAPARRALQARPNIHLLGSRSRSRLPAYIRYLDVALMPYADSLFTRYQSPMKAWEYLYAGPPIVGSGSPELRCYPPPLVHYAEDHDAFLTLVARALTAGVAGRSERRRFALANTWEDRAHALDALVQAGLRARSDTLLASSR